MHEAVLGPLDMKESTFEQPLADDMAKISATGHTMDRKPVKGDGTFTRRWRRPACGQPPPIWRGLPSACRRPWQGNPRKRCRPAMARQMLTEQKNNYGLGVGVEGSGTALRFGHGGRDEGFDARLVAYAETGQGAAIMINANDNSAMVSRIFDAIAREYRWPDYPTYSPPRKPGRSGCSKDLVAYTGHYEFADNQMLTLDTSNGSSINTCGRSP